MAEDFDVMYILDYQTELHKNNYKEQCRQWLVQMKWEEETSLMMESFLFFFTYFVFM